MTATLLLAALAMLIPPPPDWQPPHFSGPGLLCGTSYGFDLQAGESATTEWPGEFITTEILGTDHIQVASREIVVRELGPTGRSQPRGTWRDAGQIGGRAARDYGAGLFAVTLEKGNLVRTVTINVPEELAETDRRAIFARVRFTRPEGATCLRRDNPQQD